MRTQVRNFTKTPECFSETIIVTPEGVDINLYLYFPQGRTHSVEKQ